MKKFSMQKKLVFAFWIAWTLSSAVIHKKDTLFCQSIFALIIIDFFYFEPAGHPLFLRAVLVPLVEGWTYWVAGVCTWVRAVETGSVLVAVWVSDILTGLTWAWVSVIYTGSVLVLLNMEPSLVDLGLLLFLMIELKLWKDGPLIFPSPFFGKKGLGYSENFGDLWEIIIR